MTTYLAGSDQETRLAIRYARSVVVEFFVETTDYYLLQIAHMIQQLVEAGSLLRNLAAEFGRTPMQLFGSLKNLARRMLDAFRYMVLNDQAFDPLHAASIQIRLDSS